MVQTKLWVVIMATILVVNGCSLDNHDKMLGQDTPQVEIEKSEMSPGKEDIDDDLEDKATNTEDPNPPLPNNREESQTTPQPTSPNPSEFKRTKVTLASPVDGDTMKVYFEGKEESVRFLLVDTPETRHPRLGKQPFGDEAKEYTTKLVRNANILELEFDIGPTRDKYQRLLAYVYADGNSVQEGLLKNGLARVAYVYPPSTRYVDRYRSIQETARKVGIGIWSVENYAQEDGFHEEIKETEKQQIPEEIKQPQGTSYTGPYDPFGADRDCGDFSTQEEAQAFFEAAGGPERDPHRLDGNDRDGLVCENLP